jgi:hypothetical protein
MWGGKSHAQRWKPVRLGIMRVSLGLVGMMIVLLIGYWIYTSQVQEMGDNKPPKQQINLVAVKGNLLSLANAEKLYHATNGSYATLEILGRSNIMNSIPEGRGPMYQYVVEVAGTEHFKITATPRDASQNSLPTLSIDETMQLAQE